MLRENWNKFDKYENDRWKRRPSKTRKKRKEECDERKLGKNFNEQF